MGDHSPEPVDETMAGNKFHCKNKYIIIILLHVLLLYFYIINDCNRNQF